MKPQWCLNTKGKANENPPLKSDAENPDPTMIQTAAEIIRKSGLVAFPTETVYGLGADALNAEAVLALFAAKKRPLDNPPIVHVADPKEVDRLVLEVPPKAKVLMEKFWPGPLTLIFKRSNLVPQGDGCGFRHHCHPNAQSTK